MNASSQPGRVNQKRRTRAALVAAAVVLVESDKTPTISEVADRAGISRATAYRYFSSQDRLLMEAMLERRMPEIDALVNGWNDEMGAEARLEQLVESVLETVIAHETSFRAMLRASLDPDISTGEARGGRRLRWIERAIEPIASKLSQHDRQRLIATLTPFLGIEALISLGDIADLKRSEIVIASRLAAVDLLRGALSEHS